ncbi:hypothetical protein ACFW04_014453 [Cataglyphis niger]
MSYYGVANGRNTRVYDNWEGCKEQVYRYSKCDFKKFDTPNQAWDFVDQRSSSSNGKEYVNHSYKSNNKAITCRSDNQIATKGLEKARAYKRTDYMEGKNGIIIREHTYTNGRHGTAYFVEKRIRTYWEK